MPPLLFSYLAMVVAFLPPLAAWRGRRWSLGEPAGQVALCWLVMACCGAFQIAVGVYWASVGQDVSYVVAGLFPLLLLPPTLTWIGRVAKRIQWPLVGLWAVTWAVAAVQLRGYREFSVVVNPVLSIGMLVASAWALAAQVRRSTTSPWRTDWFWILLGHVLYFLTRAVRTPIMETLVAEGWTTPQLIQVQNAILLLYCACYLLIARGLLVDAPAIARSGPSRSSRSRAAADVRLSA